MPPRFRFDLPGAPPPLLGTLTLEQTGMWALLVLELWNRGPLTGAEVVMVELEKRTLYGENIPEKRTLSDNLHERTESERFLLEEVAPHLWSFGWLEEHRRQREEVSAKNSAGGKEGGRGNTRRRKAAREKANALPPGENMPKANALPAAESERFEGGENMPESERFQASSSNGKANGFEGADEGARVREQAPADTVTLFQVEQVGGREESTRAKAKKRGPATDEEKAARARRSIFRNSDVFELETFRGRMAKEMSLGVDVDFYWHAVLDWSDRKDTKELTTANGWIATARTFMRNDATGKNGIKMIQMAEEKAATTAAALDYFKLGK